MGFSCTRLAAIAIYLTSTVVLSFGELVVSRHPLTNHGSERSLTCASEDDDAALIWNHNIKTSTSISERNIFTSFEPKKRKIKNSIGCALRNLTACIANWKITDGWNVADSTIKPIGPVFDYRWEGLEEYVFEQTLEQEEYQLVAEVKGSSGSAVFSARGLRNIHVFLCDSDVAWNQCFGIIIGDSGNRKSTIQSCVNKVRESSRFRNRGNCEVVASAEHEPAGVIDPYEWRTFRIEWDKKLIRVFKITEDEPFLKGGIARWFSASHIYLKSELSARVRFHFYEYHLAEEKEAVLSTGYFYQYGVNLCTKLLVNLCPKCGLEIYVIDVDNRILWSQNLAVDGPLTWQPVQLTAILPHATKKLLRLEVQSILIGDGKGWWAIDNFHTCESVGRISTITVRREEHLDPPIWPRVNCQKLSYEQTALVDALPIRTTNDNTNELRQLLREFKKSCETSQCETFGANWSFCNPTGCTCDEGFKGIDCTEVCSGGTYGYNCNEDCGSCRTEVCNWANGYCYTGCRDERLLPPLCKKALEKPKVMGVSDTSAKIIQNVEPEASESITNLSFEIQGPGMKDKSISAARATPSTYEAHITNLQRNTTYTVYTIAVVDNARNSAHVRSLDISFTTTSVGELCFEVVRAEESLTLKYYKDLKGCENLLGGYYSLKLRELPQGKVSEHWGPPLPHTFTGLQPYTEYEINIPIKGGSIFTERVRTLESAPGAVRTLIMKNVSDTGVILGWSAPEKKNGIIAKYTVSIKLTTLLGCASLRRSTPPQNEFSQDVDFTTASFSELHPYAVYTATVIAYASKAGPAQTFTFNTREAKIPTSVVNNLTLDSKQLRLIWDKPLDCTTISGSIDLKRLVLTKTSGLESERTIVRHTTDDYFYVSSFRLDPYTTYKVRVHVVRGYDELVNSDLYQEIDGRTAPSAPPPVKIIELFDADFDTQTISLRWEPPSPANGEIQSYRVLIKKGGKRLINRTIEATEGVCELWTNYICFNNLNLPRDIATDLQLQISAKNKDVEELGSPGYYTLVPGSKYIEPPGAPLNLTISREGRDVVTLKWKPPPFTPTKISRFRIQVEVLETFLLESLDTKFPININYTVKEKQKEYSTVLHLSPSTNYRVSVVSVNGRSITSGVTETLYSIPGYIGLGSKEEPEVKQAGSLIEVKIPQVVNATRNTTVGIIVRGPSTCTPRPARTSSSRVNLTKFVEEWEAAVYKVEKSTPEPLKIFAKQHQGVTSNCSLHLEETYTILLVATDWFSGASAKFTSSEITLINRDLPQGTNLAWLIIIPMIAISLLSLFVWQRKFKSVFRQPREPSYLDVIPLDSSTTSPNSLAIRDIAPDSISLHEPVEIPLSTSLYEVPTELDSCPVSLEYFEEYAKGAAASGRLYSQFKLLPRGLNKPCDYGSLPENMPKNRYRNLIAYDHTRVVLEKIPGDSYSDYINASYIKGYRKQRAYIATQAPKPNTVNEFWRMIWQEDVRVICMLANVVEGFRTMCEKYWPDVGTRVKYGEFLISNTSNQVFAHYTFRTFKLSYRRDTREVTHLHYTGWPILGVPSSQSLVEYMKKLFQTPAGNGPVVVHCDTGDGRTGTVILCDICLRQAIAERIIDVTAVITRMRDSRANMVATPQQYLLAHIIISESIVSIPTQIPCTGILSEEIQKLRRQLPNDLQRLNDTMWHQEALDYFADLEPLDELVPESVAVSNSDVSRTLKRKSNQISAVSVDGVKTKNQYLASWLPPPLTLSNFWKFITEEKIKLIIILQCSDPKSPTCCDILPDERISLSMLHMEVQTETTPNEGEYFTTEKLLLTETSEKNARTQSVTVLTCKGWDYGKTRRPPTPAALVSLWEASEKVPREAGKTLVLCHDGITGCGLYLALSFVLERMAVDRECDVISAVRTVRRSIPEFVQSKEQCEYLYDAAETYAEYFQHYANFM